MKAIGYLLLIVGLLAALVTLEPVKKVINISLPESIPESSVLIGAGIVIVIGLLLAFGGKKGSGKGASEVPIYEGSKIVGYRRV